MRKILLLCGECGFERIMRIRIIASCQMSRVMPHIYVLILFKLSYERKCSMTCIFLNYFRTPQHQIDQFTINFISTELYINLMMHTTGSLTTSRRLIILGPPRRFSKIFISRLIFFFLTGCKRNKYHVYIAYIVYGTFHVTSTVVHHCQKH